MFYLVLNDAFADFISQNISAGGARGLQGFSIIWTVRSFFIIIEKSYSFIPLAAGILWIIKNLKSNRLLFYIGFTFAFVLTVLFLAVIGTNFNHYNMILVPFLAPGVTFFIQNISQYLSNLKHRKIVTLLFLCIIFSSEIISARSYTLSRLTDRSRNEHIAAGNIIDKNTVDGDKIIALGRERRIYLFTDRRPASRFIYQLSGAEYYPNARTEFLSDMENRRPAVIVIANRYGRYDHLPEWFLPIYNMIENEYHILWKSDTYFLFRRNEN
jgi:hypothetical protein